MKVVLLRLSALGDIVHTWPLAVALRASRPDIHLAWVVEEPLLPLVEGHPAVDQVIPAATQRWRRRPLSRQTVREIGRLRECFAALRPDLCIDAQGVLKSSIVALWTAAPRRVGLALPWRRERLAGLAYTETLPGSSRHRHVVATNLELVRAIAATPPHGLHTPDGSWLLHRSPRKPLSAAPASSTVVLLPGAGHPKKALAPRTLAEVAEALKRQGLDVVVAWGPGELPRAQAIARQAGVDLAPPTDLIELAHLLGGAVLVVGGDTGPVHLAASLGVPTLGVFLATSWQRNGPLGSRVHVVSAVEDGSTRPSGSARALRVRTISARDILDGVAALLAAT